MNNIKKAKLIKLNKTIEEEVTLLIDGEIIECFASFCPYDLDVGKTYDVELSLNLPQSYEIKETERTDVHVIKKGRGFSYYLYGILDNEIFRTFTPLFDENLHYEHPDLNNHFICLEVERIDASFC